MAFQPISELETGTVIGFESLARFESQPRRSPAAWFEEAATAGLRRELELAAVRAAIGDMGCLPDHAYLTINVSPDVAMSKQFVEMVAGAGPRIVVELTEHAPIEDYDALNAALETLRTHGVRIAIDDAGAGFANMKHILRLDADLIKLDVELTRHIDVDARRKAMVSSLVEYARTVGATLVAEGIETEAELLALRRLGVHAGQGYHLGRPGRLGAAPAAIEAGRASIGRWRSVVNGFSDAASFTWGRGRRGRRPSFAPRVALVLIGALLVGPATLAMAENADPGSPGYWIKRRVEDVRLLVASDGESEMRLHMAFAQRRLNELNQAVASGNRGATAMVIADYRRHVENVARALPDDPHLSASMSRWVVDELTDYVAALEREEADSCAMPRSSSCAPIERAVKRSKDALKKVNETRSRRGAGRTAEPPATKDKPSAEHPDPAGQRKKA